MRTSILIFLLVANGHFHLQAQDSAANKSVIKTNLVSYLPNLVVNTGKANLEFEWALGNFRSSLVECGFIYSYGPTEKEWISPTITQKSTRGFMLNYEVRHYFNRSRVFEPLCLIIWPLVFQLNSESSNNTGLYLSGEADYRHTITEIPQVDGIMNISRANPFLLINIGFQSINKKRLCVDQSFGVGLQYITSFSGSRPSALLNSPIYTEDRRHFFPMLNYSFKIGFELRR